MSDNIFVTKRQFHQQIWRDLSDDDCTYQDKFFRGRNRMKNELFLRFLKDIEDEDIILSKRKIAQVILVALHYKR